MSKTTVDMAQVTQMLDPGWPSTPQPAATIPAPTTVFPRVAVPPPEAAQAPAPPSAPPDNVMAASRILADALRQIDALGCALDSGPHLEGTRGRGPGAVATWIDAYFPVYIVPKRDA